MITVVNSGPSAATDVQVLDQIPHRADLRGRDAAERVLHRPPADIPPADEDHDLLTCTLAGPIQPGGSQTVTVSMRAETDLAAIGEEVVETVTIQRPVTRTRRTTRPRGRCAATRRATSSWGGRSHPSPTAPDEPVARCWPAPS